MHQRHQAVYDTLTQPEFEYLAQNLVNKRLLPGLPTSRKELIGWLSQYSHAEVVLSLANDPSEIGIDIVEKLIAKPIYMCARGETSEQLTDIQGNPILTPLGHRRHEPPYTSEGLTIKIKNHIKGVQRRIDTRIVTKVIPNPKRPGSAAYARFNEYVVGKSVAWHLGNTNLIRPDINWDSKHDFITLESAVHMSQDRRDAFGLVDHTGRYGPHNGN